MFYDALRAVESLELQLLLLLAEGVEEVVGVAANMPKWRCRLELVLCVHFDVDVPTSCSAVECEGEAGRPHLQTPTPGESMKHGMGSMSEVGLVE